MATKEHKERKRGGKKSGQREVPASASGPIVPPRGRQVAENLFFEFFAFFCGHPPCPSAHLNHVHSGSFALPDRLEAYPTGQPGASRLHLSWLIADG